MKKLVSLLIAMCFPANVSAQDTDWKKTWDATLAAAQKEGKVVVVGSPDPVMRNEIIPAFQARYKGINVEYLAGRSSQTVGRVRLERAASVYTVDIFLSGADTSYNVLYKEKMIDPLKPMLILPEVADGKNWKGGKPWFMDPEEKYVLRPFNILQSSIFFNADRIKPEELTKAEDLLNPKWKGKIVTEPPTSSAGSGGNQAASVYVQLGPEFTKKLYIDQQPVISGDRRQLTDWLARGTHYICLTCRVDDVTPLQKDGFKIMRVYDLEGFRTRVVSSPFLVSVANKAPNPNAMRVFVNWLLTKEAQDIYARGYGTSSMRTDADNSFLDPRTIPQPGIEYPDDSSIQWRSVIKVEAMAKLRELLKTAK